MPVLSSDGILGTSYSIFPTSAQLSSLTVSGTMSSIDTTATKLTVLDSINQGTQTYSITMPNIPAGAGYSLNLSQNTVSILNTGNIPTIASAFVGISSVVGNGALTAGDICSLFIEGAPNVTNLANTGIYSLKVSGTALFTNNMQIGGNLALTGTLTSSNAISTSGVFTNTNTTESTNTTSGAAILSGGLAVQKNVNIGGSLSAAGGITFSAGKMIYSVRSPITTGSPYTLDFFGNDNYTIIVTQPAAAFILNVPPGVNGQLLIIINIGVGAVSVFVTVEGAATSTTLSQTDRMSLFYYAGSWRSMV